MPENALLKGVKDNLAIEQVVYRDVMEHGSSINTLHKTQRKLLQALQKIGASDDLDSILLMGIDKELIGVRKTNLKKAWAKYIELQKNALVTPETEPGIENNRDGPQ